ncbi:MAG: hypothetical protein HYY26_05520 [Acidobacteria bacterium]|nr:hypothetical protein [Acidobacteriota bacterium]
MDAALLLAILAVIACWLVVAYGIRRWGPGRAPRWVYCPERKRPAKIVVEQREGTFGQIYVEDVLSCSLFDDRPLGCDKACLHRL